MKKPNFDHNKWSKLKNQDFPELNVNKLLHYKKIIVNMLCLYVYVISFSTSVRSNQALSLFVDQFAGCRNQGMVGTDSMSWLVNLGNSWPFLIYFPVDVLRISQGKLAIFQLDIRERFKKDIVIMFWPTWTQYQAFFEYFWNKLIFCPLKVFSKISENESS